MPRQNRYHPYACNRQSSQTTPSSPPLASPRYPSPLSLTFAPTTLYAVPELVPTKEVPVQPFQASYQPCIQGTTTDGKALVTKPMTRGPDRPFYIEMPAARFPSEYFPKSTEASVNTECGGPYQSPPGNESYMQNKTQAYYAALQGVMSNLPSPKA